MKDEGSEGEYNLAEAIIISKRIPIQLAVQGPEYNYYPTIHLHTIGPAYIKGEAEYRYVG